MRPLALYCKSFRTDLRRVLRLAESIEQFNQDNLPFYVSVPNTELSLFQQHLQEFNVTLIADEAIIEANSNICLATFKALPGNISQQIVKSEFWRLNQSLSYLCLDSDSVFIRNFTHKEFVAPDGTPYSVITEAQDLQFEALCRGKLSVINDFRREAETIQTIFQRPGKAYSFGPMPMVWHRAVWESLEQQYLIPRGMNFLEAIQLAPLESRWYGEALLRFCAIPLLPSEPFFKVYHYAWQLDRDRCHGITDEQLAKLYSGVIFQSSWEREMDWPHEGGHILSHLSRRIRRRLGRI